MNARARALAALSLSLGGCEAEPHAQEGEDTQADAALTDQPTGAYADWGDPFESLLKDDERTARARL
jgi:hypothetical protein